MNEIQRKTFSQQDRQDVQDNAIAAVKADPERFIDAYRRDARSFGGRYVAADLFKETFPAFSASKEARNRFNTPVHNSAAVLSAELFARNLDQPMEPGRETVYFLTGSPGAGKTSLVLDRGLWPTDAHMVFEGQMSNFDTSREKIQQVLDAGFSPLILAVHSNPENAMRNTLQRFNEEGRGASIEAIAGIQGNLPGSMERLASHFGNRVKLEIVDVRDRDNPIQYFGFEHIGILKSEGNYEQIKQRLGNFIDDLRAAGSLTDDAYRQAAGLAPADRLSIGTESPGDREASAPGRGSSEGSGKQAVLNPKAAPVQEAPAGATDTADGSDSRAAKEKALRVVLESEMDKAGLSEPDRIEQRSQLDAALIKARSAGQDLQIPDPLISDPTIGRDLDAPSVEPGNDPSQAPDPER